VRKALTLPVRTALPIAPESARFRATDFDAIHAYSSDPRVTRYLFFGPRDEDSTADYLEGLLASQTRKPRTRFELAVEEIASGRVIGACDLSLIERNVVDLGYMLGAPDWGKGYATEIALALGRCGIFRSARRSGDFHRRCQQRRLDPGAGENRHALGSGVPQASPRQESLVGLPPVHLPREVWEASRTQLPP
jgi:hypothetical protein